MSLTEQEPEAGFRGLSDEQLIRAYCADPPSKAAGDQLVLRCLPKLQHAIRWLVYGGGRYAPRGTDREAFYEDAVGRASQYFISRIPTFRFEGAFDGWLAKLAKCAVLDERRKIQGRGVSGSPKLEPLESVGEISPQSIPEGSFQSKYWHDPARLVRDREYREIAIGLLEMHAQSSNHGLESAGALRLRIWDERTVSDIAAIRGSSERDVWRLFARDYEHLRALMESEFHIHTVRHI